MRSRKFWGFAITIAVVWYVIQRAWLVSEATLDNIISAEVGLVLVASAIGMVIVRRDWTQRALGVFGVFLATGAFYLVVFASRMEWITITRDWLNPIRAGLLVAGNAFAIGFLRWVLSYGFRGMADDAAVIDPVVTPKRRASDWRHPGMRA